MPIPAQAVDPRKAFNYRIEIDGLLIALVRKVNVPKTEFGAVEHAHAGQRNMTKTAGKEIIGDITLEKIYPEDGQDRYFSDWRALIKSGGAAAYKRTVDIFHLGPDETRVAHYVCTGCFPREDEQGELDAMSEGDVILQTIVLSCDDVVQRL